MSPRIVLKELPPVVSRGCSDFLVQLYKVRGEGKEKGRREEREKEGKGGEGTYILLEMPLGSMQYLGKAPLGHSEGYCYDKTSPLQLPEIIVSKFWLFY